MLDKNRFNPRFFETTRGKIVMLLKRSNMTVNELVAQLGLTDNAVRAHLLSLERDGIVKQLGTVKGVRKPHYIYGLSPDARDLFPRPYGKLFNQLLTALKSTLRRPALVGSLRTVGDAIGSDVSAGVDQTRAARLDAALEAIESLGGAAVVTEGPGVTVIQSDGCPFAEAVSSHPEVCKVAESMLSTILETEVTETCDRSGEPKCRFELREA